ncbi:MAG TPA: hypothetical protein VIF81_02965 [Pyrinomonadaceae bacterium]|jgi:hypothetical protein
MSQDFANEFPTTILFGTGDDPGGKKGGKRPKKAGKKKAAKPKK